MGIAKNAVNCLGKTMKSWREEQTYSAETHGKRGIFQRDVLSLLISLIPLTHILRTVNPGYDFRTGETINCQLSMDDLKLYCKSGRTLDSLIQTARIFSEDTERQLGIEKCAMLLIKKGKIVNSDGIELSNDKLIKSLE